jgi:type IV pilus assembly protein PilE
MVTIILNNTIKGLAMKQQGRGFSLIELMITVAIVSILAAVAYPSYTQYVMRGKRAEARTLLLEAAAREERFYSDNNQYTSTIGSGGLGLASNQSENGHYTLTIGSLGTNNQAFTLTATPAQTDSECGNLTLTNAGAKGSSDNALCWAK